MPAAYIHRMAAADGHDNCPETVRLCRCSYGRCLTLERARLRQRQWEEATARDKAARRRHLRRRQRLRDGAQHLDGLILGTQMHLQRAMLQRGLS